MKKCKSCGVEKQESEFFKSKKWLEGKCKVCRGIKNKLNFDKNREENLSKERLRGKKRRETEEIKKWRKKYEDENRKEISLKAREYYIKNKQRLSEKTREWRNLNKEKYNKCVEDHKIKNPEKLKARRILNYHLLKGNMSKPIKCSECKLEKKTEAHHEDYSKPLDVKWLCRDCHAFMHRKY